MSDSDEYSADDGHDGSVPPGSGELAVSYDYSDGVEGSAEHNAADKGNAGGSGRSGGGGSEGGRSERDGDSGGGGEEYHDAEDRYGDSDSRSVQSSRDGASSPQSRSRSAASSPHSRSRSAASSPHSRSRSAASSLHSRRGSDEAEEAPPAAPSAARSAPPAARSASRSAGSPPVPSARKSAAPSPKAKRRPRQSPPRVARASPPPPSPPESPPPESPKRLPRKLPLPACDPRQLAKAGVSAKVRKPGKAAPATRLPPTTAPFRADEKRPPRVRGGGRQSRSPDASPSPSAGMLNPGRVVVEQVRPTDVVLSWDAPGGAAPPASYRVMLSHDSGRTFTVHSETAGRRHRVGGLAPNSPYHLSVVAKYEGGGVVSPRAARVVHVVTRPPEVPCARERNDPPPTVAQYPPPQSPWDRTLAGAGSGVARQLRRKRHPYAAPVWREDAT